MVELERVHYNLRVLQDLCQRLDWVMKELCNECNLRQLESNPVTPRLICHSPGYNSVVKLNVEQARLATEDLT